MAPPKQKAASYELIETGGGEGYRTVSLPAPRPAVQDDNDLIYRPAPVAVEQVVELHDEEE